MAQDTVFLWDENKDLKAYNSPKILVEKFYEFNLKY